MKADLLISVRNTVKNWPEEYRFQNFLGEFLKTKK